MGGSGECEKILIFVGDTFTHSHSPSSPFSFAVEIQPKSVTNPPEPTAKAKPDRASSHLLLLLFILLFPIHRRATAIMVAPSFLSYLRRFAVAYYVLSLISCTALANANDGEADNGDDESNNNPCQIYLAESTIPNGTRLDDIRYYYARLTTAPVSYLVHLLSCFTAGLGVFAGTPFKYGEMIGRVGDAAFPVVDQDWHNSPEWGSISKHEGDYHWPLTNYDWNAPDIGMENEAEDVSVTVTGFGGKDYGYARDLFLFTQITRSFISITATNTISQLPPTATFDCSTLRNTRPHTIIQDWIVIHPQEQERVHLGSTVPVLPRRTSRQGLNYL